LAYQAAKELADCCCEIKEKIGDDGQKTRDLINEQARFDAVRRDSQKTAEILYLKGKLATGVVV
jgi:hypothetical protein